MKFSILFLIGLILLMGSCKKEVPTSNANASFAKTYVIDGNQVLLGSTKAPDGGYLLWGSSEDVTTNDPNGFLMKLDANQDLEWHKMVGGNRKDEIRSACYDNAGNIIATGMSISFDKENRNGDFRSMLTVYLTSGGDVIWEKYYTAPYTEPNISTVANKVLYLPNGNFALVGTSKNYSSSIYYDSIVKIYRINMHTRPFILTINNKGDTIGTASFDVLLDDSASGKSYIHSRCVNALITKDGSILLFVVKENQYLDLITRSNVFNLNQMDFESWVTLFKVNPNNNFGYNNYTWKRFIPNMKIYCPWNKNDNFFLTVPFKLTNTAEEQYYIGYPTLTERLFNYAILNKEGDLISNAIPSSGLLSSSNDFEFIDGSLFLLSSNSFTKLNINGQQQWTYSILSSFSLGGVSGIYPQKDKSVLVFCSSLNNKFDFDIGCLKFSEFGELLSK